MSETDDSAKSGCGVFIWLFVALYAWVGREVGSVGAYYGSKWSNKPIDNSFDTIWSRALRASQHGMLTGAIVAAIAGMAAVGITYRRCGAWSLAVGLVVAAVAGAIAGFCSGYF
jgi:hypothetical protein